MSERSGYNPGEFCWVDLATTDIDGAKDFYRDLIGWEWEPAGPAEEVGGYGFFSFNGKQVAGAGPVQADGQPSAWSGYVCVEEADATAAKVTEAGGTVLVPPFELPSEAGRMAVCQDTGGAFLSIMQQRSHRGAELVNEVGTWTWNQLVTDDIEGAKKFYGEVFGWSLEASPEAPPESPYMMWQVEGQKWEEGLAGAADKGAMQMPSEIPNHWQVYLAVADADAAVKTTKDAGGQVFLEPLEIPVGKMAVMNDPQGAAVAIIQPNYPEQR